MALPLALLLLGAVARAEPYAVGSVIAGFTLEDPHGQPHEVDARTRAVLLTRDMDGGGLVREALAERGATLLAAAGAVYVADVHGMPGPIRRWIAIPRMRSRGYPVLLDPEGSATASFPSEPGQASWIRLEGLRIVEVRFLASAAAVRAALETTASPPGE